MAKFAGIPSSLIVSSGESIRYNGVAYEAYTPFSGVDLSSYLTISSAASTYYLQTNPSGYITSSAVAATYVPYTGATGNVNLGVYSLSAGSINSSGALTLGTSGILLGGTNLIQQRNATNAQRFEVHNTYTSGTNLERFIVDWQTTSNTCRLGVEKGSGGGTARDLVLITDSTTRVTLGATGDVSINTTLATMSTATINTGSQGFTSGFHFLSWNNGAIGWISTGTVSAGSTPETAFYRGGAQIIEQRSSTSANCFSVYNTWTDASNYERAVIDWKTTSNTLRVGTEKLGSGTARDLAFVTDGTERVKINAAGNTTFSKAVYQASEITNTTTGTTQTITLNDANHQTLDLGSATGSVTATLTVPSSACAGTLVIKQHASAAKGITWAVSSGSIKWLGTQPTWGSDTVGSYRVISWRYNGSIMFLMSTESGT